jgi:hypothetical protein
MQIPAVLIAQVMGYLPLTDRMEARGVSQSWRKAVDESSFLWRNWIFNDFSHHDDGPSCGVVGNAVFIRSCDPNFFTSSLMEKLKQARCLEIRELPDEYRHSLHTTRSNAPLHENSGDCDSA